MCSDGNREETRRGLSVCTVGRWISQETLGEQAQPSSLLEKHRVGDLGQHETGKLTSINKNIFSLKIKAIMMRMRNE